MPPPQLSADKIKLPHESYPYNKKIAQVLYMTTFLEKWGSGAKRMIELCHEQNVAEPEWVAENGTIKIVFKRPISGGNVGSYSTNEVSIIELTERQREIISFVKEDCTITSQKISQKLSEKNRATTRTIIADMLLLQQMGYLHREGGRKNGRWVIENRK